MMTRCVCQPSYLQDPSILLDSTSKVNSTQDMEHINTYFGTLEVGVAVPDPSLGGEEKI